MEPLPELHVTGTHYDVGHAIGTQFPEMILGYMAEDVRLNQDWLPFLATEKGKELYAGYLSVVERVYPQYIQELQGMADAVDIPFSKFFTVALRPELSSIIYLDKHGADGCTDIYLRTPEQFLLGHTEDLSRQQQGRVFIVHATIHPQADSAPGDVVEKFTAITCAGMLPGNTFGVLPGCGLVYTINNLRPAEVGRQKIPRHILNRALLASMDFDDMLERIQCKGVGIATGCCVNVGLLNGPELWTVEVAPVTGKAESVVEKKQFLLPASCTRQTFVHANKYELLKVRELPRRSSEVRCQRVTELPAPEDISGIQRILGDEKGDTYRIFNHNMESGVETLFTVIVDLLKAVAYVYSQNPKLGPSNTLPLL